MLIDLNHGTNREKATDEELFKLCDKLWEDEELNVAFRRVGKTDYFTMDEYHKIHIIITEFWQEGGGDTYLGDLMMAEAIVRRHATGEFVDIDGLETRIFIEKHRPHRHDDGSLATPERASLDEVLEFISDMMTMDGIEDFCEEVEASLQSGDRERIEAMQRKENYYAERYRRKKGYMEKLGYTEAFCVMRDLIKGEYKRELQSDRLREKVEQSLGFWG